MMKKLQPLIIVLLTLVIIGLCIFLLLSDGEYSDSSGVVGKHGSLPDDWEGGGPFSGKRGKADSSSEKAGGNGSEDGGSGGVDSGVDSSDRTTRREMRRKRGKKGEITNITREQWEAYIRGRTSSGSSSGSGKVRRGKDGKIIVTTDIPGAGGTGAGGEESGNASDTTEEDDKKATQEETEEEESEVPTRAALEGYVIDEDGAPIEGALVTMSVETIDWRKAETEGEAANFPMTAYSDADGRFSFSDLPIFNFTLKVERQGFVPGYFASLEVGVGENYVEVVLHRNLTISGVVISENDVPLADAKVTATYKIEVGINFVTEAFTNSDGEFQVPVQAASTNTVKAEKYGYTTAKPLSVPQGKTDCVLVLTSLPMGLLTGRVVDMFTGDPLHTITLDGEEYYTSDGMFELERVATEKAQTLMVGAPGYPEMGVSYTLQEGESKDLGQIALCDGLILRGIIAVMGNEPLEPIEGASVKITPIGGEARTYVTEADGTFSFDQMPLGQISIRVTATGYATYATTMNMEPPDPEKPESREVFIQILLAPGMYSVQGKVTDAAEGEPIADVNLHVVELPGLTAITDNSGNYKIDQITRRRFRVRAEKTGYVSKTSDYIRVTAENPLANCNFIMERGGGFYGVLLCNGKPVAPGVEATLWKKIEGGINEMHAADTKLDENKFSVVTTEDGKFEFKDIKDGEYFLHVDSYRLYPTAVTVGGAGNSTQIELPGATEVSGRITYADGSPVANTSLYLHSGDHDYSIEAAHTDADGNYTIQRLARKPYALSIIKSIVDQSAQYLHEFTVNSVPVQTVNVKFPPLTSSIYGRLTDGEGYAKAGIFIGVEYLDSPHRAIIAGWVKTDDNGCYIVPRLEPGKHMVRTAWTSDENVFNGPITLAEGNSIEVNLVAPRVQGRTITGYSVTSDGSPAQGSFCFAVNEAGEQAGNFFGGFRWEYSSAFNMRGLAPGNYTLIFTAIGCKKKSIQVAVTNSISNLVVTLDRE
ncbi:MAG: carboxypeptidase regulatory-like domain-containing protein [Planctomycetota bacterium]|jgi:hypothetical protein